MHHRTLSRRIAPSATPLIVTVLVATVLVTTMVVWARHSAAPASGLVRGVALRGVPHVLPDGAHALGPLPDRRPLHLIIGFAPRNTALLDRIVGEQRALGARGRGAALSPAGFGAIFGPPTRTYAAVQSYLTLHGMRITRTYADRLLLDVQGDAGQVRRAFGTPLVRYRDARGHDGFANLAAPRLPADLAAVVSTVIGLRDDGRLRYGALPIHSAPHALHTPVRHAGRSVQRSAGAIGLHAVPPSDLLTPAQVRAAYALTPIYMQTLAPGADAVPITGTGQTVALLEFSPFDPADIAGYDAAFGLSTPPVRVTPVDGGPTEAFGSLGRAEATLDIELLHAAAPGAAIVAYSGPSAPTGTDDTGVDDTLARAVNDDTAQVLSTSWGQCEPDQLHGQWNGTLDLPLVHALFAQAATEGMTVLAATGDSGSDDCGTGVPSVDYPSSDPNVVGVGGTTLLMSGTTPITETGWAGSGGGAGSVYARPSWQQGPGLPAAGNRETPDVALNAATGYAIWFQGGWAGYGGTSAATPIWAGILALANQTRYAAAAARGAPTPAPCAVEPGLGNPLADLYRLAATPPPTPAFRDITVGASNGAGVPGPGWDPVTGWGVPVGIALVQSLVAEPDLAPPTPGPCPTGVPQLTATGTATPTSSATATATATSTATSTDTATATASPTPSATSTRTPTSTRTATDTPSATATATPTPTSTTTASPTADPRPTNSPTPTAATSRLHSTSNIAPRGYEPGPTATALPSATRARPGRPASSATRTPTRTPVARRPRPTPSATPSTHARTRSAAHATPRSPGACGTPPSGTNASRACPTATPRAPRHTARAARAAPRHVNIPRLVATLTVQRRGATPWAALRFQFAPRVALTITLIERGTPRRHLTLRTDARGIATARVRLLAPKAGHSLTVTVRAWGVYAHHRKTAVLRATLHG